MNGAQSLIASLVKSDVEVCFSNPGTSEMHFVAALDSVPQMRGILCLFEGVASGAADGYARMAEKPASALFHLAIVPVIMVCDNEGSGTSSCSGRVENRARA